VDNVRTPAMRAILVLAALVSTVATSAYAQVPARQQTVKDYCAGCHNDRLRTGGLSLEGADLRSVPAHPEIWEKVVRKLRLGVMPPQGARRPDAAVLETLATSLEQELDAAAVARTNPGRPALHRLNRAEYANAIRDLLGLEVDVSTLLPADNAAYGFDNVADALGSSPALLQAYDTTTGKRVAELPIGTDPDDLFFDSKRRQLYAVCGEGVVDVVRRREGDRLELAERVETAPGSRTGLYVAQLSTLFVAAPTRAGTPAQIRVYTIK